MYKIALICRCIRLVHWWCPIVSSYDPLRMLVYASWQTITCAPIAWCAGKVQQVFRFEPTPKIVFWCLGKNNAIQATQTALIGKFHVIMLTMYVFRCYHSLWHRRHAVLVTYIVGWICIHETMLLNVLCYWNMTTKVRNDFATFFRRCHCLQYVQN